MSSKLRLFICDDEQSKLVSLRELLGDLDYEYERIPRIEELKARLQAEDLPDAVFLDLIFEGAEDEPSKTLSKNDISVIREELGRHRPLFIYTQHTDTQTDLLRDIVFEGLADWWIMLEEFESLTADNIKLRLQKALGDYSGLRDGLWITQLSDIHFGKQFVHIDRPIGEVLARDVANKISEQPPGSDSFFGAPALTVFSGDFTQSGSMKEFEQAKKFLNGFEAMLLTKGVRRPLSIIAPGNHEACWDLSITTEHIVSPKGKLIAKKSLDPELHKIKWTRFCGTFQNQLSAAKLEDNEGRYWAYDLSNRFGCNIYVVNTSFWITYKNDNPEFKSEWIDQLAEIDTNSPGILVAHHPMNSWFSGKDADKNLRKLLDMLSSDLKVKLVFSGHKHDSEVITHTASNQKRIFEVITGSVAVAEEEQPSFVLPSFRTINIRMDKNGNWSSFRTWLARYVDSKYLYLPQGDEDTFYHEYEWEE